MPRIPLRAAAATAVAIAASLALSVATGAGRAASYLVTTIDAPDAVATYALGSNAGQVVGWYQDSAEIQHGFLARPFVPNFLFPPVS